MAHRNKLKILKKLPEFLLCFPHGHNGFLAPAKAIDRLAGHIVDLLRNPDLAREMGAAGRCRVKEDFTKDQAITRISDLYQKMYRVKHPTG